MGQGVVRDSDGKPVAGASVTALSFDQNSKPLPGAVVKTDAAGRYSISSELPLPMLDSLRQGLKLDAKSLYLVVLVHAPGYAVAQQIIQGGATKTVAPAAEVKLARGFTVTQRVVDDKGKPLNGVTVRASEIQLQGKERNAPDSEIWLELLHESNALRRELQIVTGADGLFTLRDIPAGMLRLVLSAPTFIDQHSQVAVGASAPPTGKVPDIKLVQGVAVSGRVLYPDGKPVAGVQVTAQSQITPTGRTSMMVTTKPDGTYKFENLPVGKIDFLVAAPSPDWTETRLPPREVRVGVETKVDITLSQGVLLTGYVRETGVKTPLEGITVYAQQNDHSVAAKTDDKGRYQVRLQPGTYRFWTDESGAPDFLPRWDNQPQLAVTAKSKVAPNFLLTRGAMLTGTALDEQGQPAVGAVISVRNNGPEKSVKVDEKGNWTLKGIDTSADFTGKGKGVVQVAVSGEWALRGDPLVTLPAKPLALTLSRIALQQATVRVVTTDGQAVGGATVTYQAFLSSQGDSWYAKKALTNEAGEAQLEGLRPEKDSEVTAKKAGFVLRQKGRVAHEANGTIRTTQAVLEPLDAKVSGRVVDTTGQPVAGARVACLFPADLRELPDTSGLTDANGNFALQGLPRGEFVLGVAKGRAFGQGKAQANGTLELKLGPDAPALLAHDSQAAFGLLQGWLQGVRDAQGVGDRGSEMTRLAAVASRLVPYDATRAQRLMTDAQGNLDQDFAVLAPLEWASTDPKSALAWGKTIVPLIQDGAARTNVKIQLASLTAQVDPQWARQVYDEVAQAVNPTALEAKAAPQYARLAGLAGALQDPDAEGWLQALTLTVNAMNQEARFDLLNDTVDALALGDLPTARRWAEPLPPLLKVQVLNTLVTHAAQHNLPAALPILADLRALIQGPDLPMTQPGEGEGPYQEAPTDVLSSASNTVLTALLESDPRAAQKMLEALPTDEQVEFPDTIKAEITARLAGAGDEDKVKEALDKAREDYDSPAGNMAFIAALVRDTLPQLSAQAFKDARDKLANPRDDWRNGELVALYAYARAATAPEESRLLLESQWLRTLDEVRKTKEDGQKGNTWEQAQRMRLLIKAMVALDPNRANAMLQEALPLNEDISYYNRVIRLRIVDWLLADAPTRLVMPLQHDQNDDDSGDD